MSTLSSSSSEAHGYYSGEEVNFGDELALPDTSKFLHISKEEIQGYVPMMVSPIARIAVTEGISFVFLNWFPIKLRMSSDISFWLSSTGLAAGSEVTTFSHIEEMIQELAQQEDLEAPTTGTSH